MKWDVGIVGGGAAGLMCALTAARRGRRVVLIEHAKRVGRKILMSGGGRCNFTNLYVEPENYLSLNPHFCKSALARYSQWDFITMVEAHGIAYHEKEAGQLFCDESSKLILQMLLSELQHAGVEILLNCRIDSVQATTTGFMLQSTRGELELSKLVLATGGLSIPKMGASGFAYELASQFGHEMVPTRAALVPFTLSGRPLEDWAELAGLSSEVIISCGKQSFRGGLLLTHRGISGPAVLQISSYWREGESLQINWLPELQADQELLAFKAAQPKQRLESFLALHLPKRLAQHLLQLAGLDGAMAQLSHEHLRQFGMMLNAWSLKPSGTEGYRTAEVTLGGVATHALSSSDMESQLQPGLHIIGEALDVTGHLGGFNFQWAWASGHAAGQVV